jgi:serine/threonine protein phosphatase PrpC
MMRIRPDVELANLTDLGLEREINEDYYLYAEPESDEEFARKGRLLLVADGMGGHNGGEVASGLAAAIIREAFAEAVDGDPHTILVEGFSRAQQAILERANSDFEVKGMGTTCTAAIVHQGALSFGHIGDSRLYLIRDGSIVRLTDDHTLVNQMFKAGALTEEEASHHEQKNVLTSALGMPSRTVSADFSESPIPLQTGDILLASSDGLHGLVSDAEILEVTSKQTPYAACRKLVDLARERGGPDNITLQILRIAAVTP